jgi:uroporphyrinogen-III synthase
MQVLASAPIPATGFLVSSQQAAAALVDNLDVAGAAVRLPVFAVGERSAQIVRAAGFSVAVAASAQLLLPLLEAAGSELVASGRPLLYLVGDKRLDTLPRGLAELGISFTEIEVYRTCVVDAPTIHAHIVTSLERTGEPGESAGDILPARCDGGDDAALCQSSPAVVRCAPPCEAAASGAERKHTTDVGNSGAAAAVVACSSTRAAHAPPILAIVVFSPSGLTALFGNAEGAASRGDATASAGADAGAAGAGADAGAARAGADAGAAGVGADAGSDEAARADVARCRFLIELLLASRGAAPHSPGDASSVCGSAAVASEAATGRDSSISAAGALSPALAASCSVCARRAGVDLRALRQWRVALVAIGKTTAAAMEARGLRVAAVCPSPDPAGVRQALQLVAERL